MQHSGGLPMGDYTHCCHCNGIPWMQLFGWYLCKGCRERAEFSHFKLHGNETTRMTIDGVDYFNGGCYSLNPEHE